MTVTLEMIRAAAPLVPKGRGCVRARTIPPRPVNALAYFYGEINAFDFFHEFFEEATTGRAEVVGLISLDAVGCADAVLPVPEAEQADARQRNRAALKTTVRRAFTGWFLTRRASLVGGDYQKKRKRAKERLRRLRKTYGSADPETMRAHLTDELDIQAMAQLEPLENLWKAI